MIGPLIGADDVCAAYETTLQQWLPSVITEEAAYKNLDPLPVPATYEQLPDEAALNTAKFPALIVSSPGLSTRPEKLGTGLYKPLWDVVVSYVIRGNSYRQTANLTRRYATVIRTAIMQHATLGGVAEDTVWLDESYARLPANVARSIAMGHVTFASLIPGVLDDTAGPTDPATPPPAQPVQTSAQILEETM